MGLLGGLLLLLLLLLLHGWAPATRVRQLQHQCVQVVDVSHRGQGTPHSLCCRLWGPWQDGCMAWRYSRSVCVGQWMAPLSLCCFCLSCHRGSILAWRCLSVCVGRWLAVAVVEAEAHAARALLLVP